MNLNDVPNRKTSVLYAVLQALIAALTALGVSSCAQCLKY